MAGSGLEGSGQPRLLTVKEVATQLRTGSKRIYQLVRERRMASLKLGRRLLIPGDALDEFVALNTEPAQFAAPCLSQRSHENE